MEEICGPGNAPVPLSSLSSSTASNRLGNEPGSCEHARVCEGATAEKKSGSFICGTQEPDQTASPAPAEIEVRAGAVLSGSGSAEHQAANAIPNGASTGKVKVTTPRGKLLSNVRFRVTK
jgi:hypothetical protein